MIAQLLVPMEMTSRLVCSFYYTSPPLNFVHLALLRPSLDITNNSRLNVSLDNKYFIHFDINPEHLKECVWVVNQCVLETIHMSLVKNRDTKSNLIMPISTMFCVVDHFLLD